MKIETTAFGLQEFNPQTVLSFPEGIPGFEQSSEFKFFHQEEDNAVVYLQSLNDPDLVFSVISPDTLNIFYEFSLNDEEVALLKLDDVQDVFVMLIVYKSSDDTEKHPLDINANIMAPLVINSKARIGIQKRLTGTERLITIKAD